MCNRLSFVGLAILLPGNAYAEGPEGRRLAYALGCVYCHHQTPREIIDAPPLLIVKAYPIEQFETLLRTGQTSSGRDLPESGSIMGIVALEQFSYLTDEEIGAIYGYLSQDWTQKQALQEEAKIPRLCKVKLDVSEH